MKYWLLIVFIGLVLQEKEVYKKFVGGRKGFSHSSLVLYTDHTYYYSERYDFPGSLKDEGEWRIKDSLLILTSSKRNKGYGNKKLFKGDSFQLKDDELIIRTTSGGEKYIDVLKEVKSD